MMQKRYGALAAGTALMAMVLAAAPAGAAPRVLFAADDAYLAATDGSSKHVERGRELREGEGLVTRSGPAQLRMPDGSTLSLQPGAFLRLTRLAGPGGGEHLIDLNAGAIRAVLTAPAGVSYRIRTVDAELVAGEAAFVAELGGSLSLTVLQGVVQAINAAGIREILAGQQAYIANNTSIPEQIRATLVGVLSFLISGNAVEQALDNAFGDGRTSNGFQATEQRGEQGGPQLALFGELPPGPPPAGNGPPDPGDPGAGPGPGDPPVDPPPPGGGGTDTGAVDAPLDPSASGYTFLFADAVNADGHSLISARREMAAEFADNGALTDITTPPAMGRGSNATGELAGNRFVQIGRWHGGSTAPELSGNPLARSATQGLHYAIGRPSPALPLGFTATYSLLAATMPTFGDGGSPPGIFSGQMAIRYDDAIRVGLDLTVAMPEDHDYRIQTAGGIADPSQSQIASSLALWNEQHRFQGGFLIEPGGRACATGGNCRAVVYGIPAGDDAEFVGLTYRIAEDLGDTGLAVNGSAIFGSGPLVANPDLGGGGDPDPTDPPVDPPPTAGPEYAIAYAGSTIGIDERYPVAAVFDEGDGAMTRYAVIGNTIESPDRGTNVTSERHDAGGIQIGRWNDGTTAGQYFALGPLTRSATQGWHYAIGLPTETLPSAIVATYDLVAATSPTFGDGASAPGTFSGQMAVRFAPITRVGVNFNVSMPGDGDYRIMTAGGVADPAQSQIAVSGDDWAAERAFYHASIPVGFTGTGRACNGPLDCISKVTGFFSGDDAGHAGVAYDIWSSGDGGGPDSIHGSAVFGLAGTTPLGSLGTESGTIDAPLGGEASLFGFASQFGPTTREDTATTFDADGRLLSWSHPQLVAEPVGLGDTAVAERFGNAAITGGRWNGGTTTGPGPYAVTYDTNQGHHYVAGVPGAIGMQAVRATYGLLGATMPTFRDGSGQAGTFSGQMAVLFGLGQVAQAPQIGLELAIDMPGDGVYNLATTGGVAEPARSEIVLLGSIGQPLSFTTLQALTATSDDGKACLGSCPASINGFLAGGGEAIGLTYRIGSFSRPDNIVGAAGFALATAEPRVEGQVDAPLAAGSHTVAAYLTNVRQPNSTTGFGANGELVAFTEGANTVTVGTAAALEVGGNEHVAWARWADGRTAGTGGSLSGFTFGRDGGLHLVAGVAPAAMPATGTATYSLAGSTAATYRDGIGTPGSFSGALAVAFGATARVGAEFQVTMPTDGVYAVQTTGGLADPTQSQATFSSAFGMFQGNNLSVTPPDLGGRACPGACAANIKVVPGGPNVDALGMVYTIGSGDGSIQGAAGFTRD